MKNKGIDHKRQLYKLYHLFSNAGKIENVLEFEFDKI